MSEGVDDQQAPPRLGLTQGRVLAAGHTGKSIDTGVGDLDTESALGAECEAQAEVSASHMTVLNRVRSEFSDELGDYTRRLGVVRPAPGVQLLRGEVPGEAGTSPGRGEAHREFTGGSE